MQIRLLRLRRAQTSSCAVSPPDNRNGGLHPPYACSIGFRPSVGLVCSGSSSDNWLMNDRQLTQHERLADLFDEDLRLQHPPPQPSRRLSRMDVRRLFLTNTRGKCISLRSPGQERP